MYKPDPTKNKQGRGTIGTMFGRKRAQAPHYNPYHKKQKLSEDDEEEKLKELKELEKLKEEEKIKKKKERALMFQKKKIEKTTQYYKEQIAIRKLRTEQTLLKLKEENPVFLATSPKDMVVLYQETPFDLKSKIFIINSYDFDPFMVYMCPNNEKYTPFSVFVDQTKFIEESRKKQEKEYYERLKKVCKNVSNANKGFFAFEDDYNQKKPIYTTSSSACGLDSIKIPFTIEQLIEYSRSGIESKYRNNLRPFTVMQKKLLESIALFTDEDYNSSYMVVATWRPPYIDYVVQIEYNHCDYIAKIGRAHV